MKTKNILTALLCIAMIFVLATPAMAATSITAPKATIVLDGVRDDAYAGPYEIKSFMDEPGATGKVWVAWDDDFIYCYFEIIDTTPNHEADSNWARDCVEMFFDWYNAKDDDTSDITHPYWQYRTASAPNEDGEQFTHGINYAAGEDGTGWYVEEHAQSQAANNVVKPLVGGDLAGGYIVETRIAYKAFGINISEGSVVGIDFMIGDNQEGDTRNSCTFLDPDFTTNNQWTEPAAVGGLLTLGAAPPPPAEPEPEAVPDAAPAAPADPAPAPAAPPQTGDNTIIILIAAMMVYAAGIVVYRKKAAK